MFQRAHDEGFSLVEVIIAMFLLMVISLAVLPLLIGATSLSVSNRATVSATAYAQSYLSAYREAFPNNSAATGTCSAAKSYAPTGIAAQPSLSVTHIVDCEITSGTHLATVSVSVADASSGDTTTLTTQILVVNP